MSNNDDLFWGCVIGMVIGLLIGVGFTVSVYDRAQAKWEHQAIRRGVGEIISFPDGTRQFCWKPIDGEKADDADN